jgi:hypothetical protein
MDVMGDIVTPVLGGVAGFVVARVIGNWAAQRGLPVIGGNPKLGKVAAALVGIPVAYAVGRKVNIVGRNQGAIILGMGLAASEAYIRDWALIGGGSSPAASTLPSAPPAASGIGADYYTEGMLGSMYDVSHAGAPYKGMLGVDDAGLDWADQSVVENALNGMEAVSTVNPVDMAARPTSTPQALRVTETMANQGDRGYAGGLYARHLFSGMMGS